MNGPPTDPFDRLAAPIEPLHPRPDFAGDLRSRLVAALDLPVQLPERNPAMTIAATHTRATTLVPYLAVADAAGAIAWYTDVFGGAETMRVTGDDGRIGHAELSLGDVTVYLSDEYREYGVAAPSGGLSSVALYLQVDDVDAVFASAVGAGASVQEPLADQPDGDRRGTLLDPFGHRWMLAQPVERPSTAEYAARVAGSGYSVAAPAAPTGAIWAALNYADAPAGIAFLTDVLGFTAELVVADEADPTVIHHSQLLWPEGGTVQAGSANRPGNPYSERPTGAESLYLVTADPHAVWARCQAAGVTVLQEPTEPDYAPGTMVFSVRDPEGNIFSVGSYGGG
ncbi:MAG TPA: VOC family protein [Ilumatobacter sp.]|nr:VOC family protein [Ilumatobacter sp.]